MSIPDKDKVTKGLTSCVVDYDCTKCPYFALNDTYDTCVRHLMLDALAVLPGAEQQSQEPTENQNS